MSQTIEPDKILNVEVAVVGAGAAGLVAACQLQEAFPSFKIVLLEAKDRVGGRLYSEKVLSADGYDEWDFGGQWVSSSQLYVMKLLEDFDVEVYPQYMKGKNKLIINNLSDIRTYSGLIPKLGIVELLDINRLMQKIESMIKEIPAKNPLECPHLPEWDNQTLNGMVTNQASFSVVKNLVEVAIRTVFGCEPSQMSLFFMLYYASLAGGFNELLDTTEGTAQQFRVKRVTQLLIKFQGGCDDIVTDSFGTMYNVIKKLESKVGRENIKTSEPVCVIEQCDDSSVLVKTVKGTVYRAKYVVCAIPPHLVNKIHFNPSLPFNRQQLNQRMPMGNMIKCLSTYKRAFWREKNLSGQSIATAKQYSESTICATFDATTSNGSPALLSFIAGEQSFYWSQKTQLERKEAVLDYLAAVFGKEARSELVAYVDKDWSKEDYNGGCPAGIMQPGCFAYFQHALRKPFGRIHFAGTETAQKWMGYIDGAVESGIRVAEEIGTSIKSPESFILDDIPQPSSVFTQKVSRSSSSYKLLGVVLTGAFLGVFGFYCFKSFN